MVELNEISKETAFYVLPLKGRKHERCSYRAITSQVLNALLKLLKRWLFRQTTLLLMCKGTSLCRVRHSGGHWLWVEDSGRAVERSADGRVLRMIGTRRDISARNIICF